MSVQDLYDSVIKFPTKLRMEAQMQGVILQDHCYNAGHRKDHCITFKYSGNREAAKAAMLAFVEMHLGGINLAFYAERENSQQCYVLFDVKGYKDNA